MSAGGEGLMQLMGNLNIAERPHKGALIDDDDDDDDEEEDEDEQSPLPDNHPESNQKDNWLTYIHESLKSKLLTK